MRKFSALRALILSVLLVSLHSGIDRKGADTATTGQPQPFVQIDALVLSRRTGLLVEGLSHRDFLIWENGIQQLLLSWDRRVVPLYLTILIDMNGALSKDRGIDSQLKALRASLTSYLRNEDVVSIIVAAESPIVLQQPTSDRRLINVALETLPRYESVQTLSADSVFLGIEQATKNAGNTTSETARHVTILISGQEALAEKLVLPEDLVRVVIESNSLFCLRTPAFVGPYFPEAEYTVGKINLTDLVALTGGQVVTDWQSFFLQMRERHRIGYLPSSVGKDAELRRIKLELRQDSKWNRDDSVLIYRRVYYVSRSSKN